VSSLFSEAEQLQPRQILQCPSYPIHRERRQAWPPNGKSAAAVSCDRRSVQPQHHGIAHRARTTPSATWPYIKRLSV